jgi:hypothetical protein
LSSFSKKDNQPLKVVVVIDKTKKEYIQRFSHNAGTYFVMEDLYLDLGAGSHQVMVLTKNRNAYFRAFYPVVKETRKPIPKVSVAKPLAVLDTVQLHKGNAVKAYYIATSDKPFKTTVSDKFLLTGYARTSMKLKQATAFEVYRNGTLIETIDMPLKKSKQYQNPGIPNLSVGRKFQIPLVAGENVIMLKPKGANPVIFRLIKERKDK